MSSTTTTAAIFTILVLQTSRSLRTRGRLKIEDSLQYQHDTSDVEGVENEEPEHSSPSVEHEEENNNRNRMVLRSKSRAIGDDQEIKNKRQFSAFRFGGNWPILWIGASSHLLWMKYHPRLQFRHPLLTRNHGVGGCYSAESGHGQGDVQPHEARSWPPCTDREPETDPLVRAGCTRIEQRAS